MFKPYKDGTIEVIQHIECHIPKVGYIRNPITNKEEHIGVYMRSKQRSQQYWERDKNLAFTPDWDKECRRDGILPEEHPEYKKHLEKWWKYRLGGYWFYNNGVPTYITGANWYYLSVYNLDIGNPKYRDIDRQYFYVWEWAKGNPNCYGFCETTKRRCFSKGTKVRMYDGSIKEIQNIITGDFVMGNDSTPRTVLQTTSGIDKMYKVIPKKWEGFTCNEVHTIRAIETIGNKKKEIFFTIEEYLKFTPAKKKRLQLERTGWELPKKEHIVDPYMLGLWLGDGMSRNFEIVNEDEEIIEYCKEYCKENGLKYHNYGNPTPKVEHLRHSMSCKVEVMVKYKGIIFNTVSDLCRYLGKINKFTLTDLKEYKNGEVEIIKKSKHHIWAEFKRLNLKNNKHIPDEYFIDSLENRLKLLAGIIDTDGCLAKKKNGNDAHFQIGFGRKAARLKNDVKKLAESCGFTVSENYYEKYGSTNLCLFGNLSIVPTKVTRKKSNKTEYKYNSLMCGFSVEYVGEDEFYGFTLDGNNLFLLENGTIVKNSGKSYRAGAISLEEASRQDNYMVGIQSKTDEDAAKFFKKTIINPFRKLPLCFKPNSNLPASGKAPQSELKFENPKMDDMSDELMSAIDYQSSTIGAYDGQKLGLYVADECGKAVGVNINDRWDIVKFCLRDEEGNIIGKTIHTSTVEKERTKSGKTKQDDDTCDRNYLEMWNKSNQEKLGEDGTTESGLIRFFIGGDYTRYLDKHGFADREKAYNAIMAERAKLKDNPRALANLIRKEPLTDREAFQADGDTCIFGNPVLIQTRYDDLMFLPKQYKEGNFHWVDGKKDGDVYFEECENGRFWVACEPEEGERNRIKSRTYSDIPDNKEHFCAGIDPFDYKIVQNGNTKGLSKGSLCIVKKDNPLKPTRYDNGVACLYLQRPPLPETFYEDCIKALKYYGCEALIERNKGDIIKYMKERGYEEFVAWLPDQPERGIYNASRESGGGVNGMVTEVIDQWIGGGVDNNMFPQLLSQLLEFDPTNTTKYDAVMSYGYALLLYKTTIRQFTRKNKTLSFGVDVSSWF